MSKKFTGVHSGGQNIPVYDKDAHSAIEKKLDTSAFQSVSGNFLTAVPESALSGYATKDYVDAAASGKLDTDTFSQVSGDFLTAVPQSYLQNTDLTVTSGKVTEISGIPLSAGGGTLPDTIPVSGVSGISVTETENEVLIGISADFATPADLEKKLDTSAFSSVSGNFLTAVPENYATKEYLSGQISGKYDTSSFAAVSGDFLTAVPESAISGFATHEEVESATSGKLDASASGQFYTTANTANYIPFGVEYGPGGSTQQSVKITTNSTINPQMVISSNLMGYPTKVDINSKGISGFPVLSGENPWKYTYDEYNAIKDYTANKSNFLTAVPESAISGKADTSALTAYQTVDGMSAYQPSGDYITEVPDTYLQNSDLTIVDNKVTEISGVELSAGTSLEFEYDSADNISAINSSAISTTPSQPLYAKSPLYAGVSGTSSFIGLETSALPYNETLLFSGSLTGYTSAKLSEDANNFERVKVFYSRDNAATLPLINSIEMYTDILSGQLQGNFTMGGIAIDYTNNMDGWYYATVANITDDVVSAITGRNYNMSTSSTFDGNFCLIKRIIGINRKEV